MKVMILMTLRGSHAVGRRNGSTGRHAKRRKTRLAPCLPGLFVQQIHVVRGHGQDSPDRLKYIEAYPGQKLSPEKPDVVFDHNASAGSS